MKFITIPIIAACVVGLYGQAPNLVSYRSNVVTVSDQWFVGKSKLLTPAVMDPRLVKVEATTDGSPSLRTCIVKVTIENKGYPLIRYIDFGNLGPLGLQLDLISAAGMPTPATELSRGLLQMARTGMLSSCRFQILKPREKASYQIDLKDFFVLSPGEFHFSGYFDIGIYESDSPSAIEKSVIRIQLPHLRINMSESEGKTKGKPR